MSRGTPNQKVIAQWLAGTRELSPRDRQAPPSATNGVAVNSMLAPTYERSYSGHGAATSNSVGYQGNMSFHGNNVLASTAQPVRGSRSHPSSPTQLNANGAAQDITSRRRSSGGDNQIASYLQIPSSINDSKGSLADFAAQVFQLDDS